MSTGRLWSVVAVLLPAAASFLAPMSTVDLTYQIRAGDLIRATGDVLRTDSFTFTVFGQAWLDQQWLSQVLLSITHDLGGWLALALLRAVLIGLICAFALIAARTSGVGDRAAAGVALATFVLGAPAMALRPQLFGMVCFAAVLALLATRRRGEWLVWLVVPVTVAWANLHGSFVLSSVVVGVAWLTDLVQRQSTARRMGILLVATALATLLTPWGASVWAYAVDLARDPRLRQLVTEWQPPAFPSYELLALVGSAVVAVAVVVTRARARDWPLVLWLIGLGLLAATSARGLAWWAIGAPVALAELTAAGRLGMEARTRMEPIPSGEVAGKPPAPRWFGGAFIGSLALVVVVGIVPWFGADPVFGPPDRLTDAPRGVAMALRTAADAGDRVYAAQPWGSWLEWTAPQVLTFVDSRIELFPSEVWEEQLAVDRADPGWEETLSRWDVRYVAASLVEQPALIAAIRDAPGWTILEEDEQGILAAPASP